VHGKEKFQICTVGCIIIASLLIKVLQQGRKPTLALGTALENRWEVTKILCKGAFGGVYEMNDRERTFSRELTKLNLTFRLAVQDGLLRQARL